MSNTNRVLIGVIAVLAIAGGGVAIAASDDSSSPESLPSVRSESYEYPVFGGFRHHSGPGKFDAAADYLDLSQEQLRAELREGKSLAQIARDHGKSVDGLVDALVAEAKKAFPNANTDQLRARFEALVNASPRHGCDESKGRAEHSDI
jgi:hypothetical protein